MAFAVESRQKCPLLLFMMNGEFEEVKVPAMLYEYKRIKTVVSMSLFSEVYDKPRQLYERITR